MNKDKPEKSKGLGKTFCSMKALRLQDLKVITRFNFTDEKGNCKFISFLPFDEPDKKRMEIVRTAFLSVRSALKHLGYKESKIERRNIGKMYWDLDV